MWLHDLRRVEADIKKYLRQKECAVQVEDVALDIVSDLYEEHQLNDAEVERCKSRWRIFWIQ